MLDPAVIFFCSKRENNGCVGAVVLVYSGQLNYSCPLKEHRNVSLSSQRLSPANLAPQLKERVIQGDLCQCCKPKAAKNSRTWTWLSIRKVESSGSSSCLLIWVCLQDLVILMSNPSQVAGSEVLDVWSWSRAQLGLWVSGHHDGWEECMNGGSADSVGEFEHQNE